MNRIVVTRPPATRSVRARHHGTLVIISGANARRVLERHQVNQYAMPTAGTSKAVGISRSTRS